MPEFVDSGFIYGVKHSTVWSMEYCELSIIRVCAEIRISHGMSIKVRVDGLCGESGVLRDPSAGCTLCLGGVVRAFLRCAC